MGFTQTCLIRKNTPEFRKKLERLGYKFSGADHIELDCIVTFPHHAVFSVFAAYHFNIYGDSFKIVWKEYIDCETNEELFLALAALRDDTDKNQWFANNKNDWYKCLDDKFIKETANWVLCASAENWHKATVEEIIEKFKDK